MWRWPVLTKPRARQLLSARVTVARDMPTKLASSSCDKGIVPPPQSRTGR